MDDTVEIPGFLIRFPAWIFIFRGSKFGDFPKLPFKDGFAYAVFTDKEQAEEYLGAHASVEDSEKCTFQPIDNALCLIGLLMLFTHKGIDYVVIDPNKNDSGARVYKTTVLIAEILRSFDSDPDSRGIAAPSD